MNEHALKVVEAARLLNLIERKGRTLFDLDAKKAAEALEGLRLAIEEFDQSSALGEDRFDLDNKPSFSAPPQLDDDSFGFNLSNSPDLVPRNKSGVAQEAFSEPELELSERPDADLAKPKPLPTLPKPVLAAAVMSGLVPKRGYDNLHDLGDDGVFYDGDESANDLNLAIDAIGDKLAFAVSKVGWTPRLRQMAHALQLANQHVSIEIERDQAFVKVPAHHWGKLNVAIAETALDQDLQIALPQPRPKNEKKQDHELEMRYGPKPPQGW